MSAAPGHQTGRNRHAKYSGSLNIQDQIRPKCQESKHKADLPSLGKYDSEFPNAPDFASQDKLNNSVYTYSCLKRKSPCNPHLSLSARPLVYRDCAFVKFSRESKLWINHFTKQIAYVCETEKKPTRPQKFMELLFPQLPGKQGETENCSQDLKTWLQKGGRIPWGGESSPIVSHLLCRSDEIPAENLHL